MIKGVSPVGSGIRFLPLVLGNFVGSILFGGLSMLEFSRTQCHC